MARPPSRASAARRKRPRTTPAIVMPRQPRKIVRRMGMGQRASNADAGGAMRRSVDLDVQFHFWVDAAMDPVLTGLLVNDRRVLPGLLQPGILAAAGTHAHDIVGDIVVVDELDAVTGLDGHGLFAEFLVLLTDRDLPGDGGRGRRDAGYGDRTDDDAHEGSELHHMASLAGSTGMVTGSSSLVNVRMKATRSWISCTVSSSLLISGDRLGRVTEPSA